jgi:hypothetical protein
VAGPIAIRVKALGELLDAGELAEASRLTNVAVLEITVGGCTSWYWFRGGSTRGATSCVPVDTPAPTP